MKLSRNILFKGLITGLAFSLVLGAVARSVAQEAAAPPVPTAVGDTAPPSPPTQAREMTLWQWFVIGGWCMWPLMACSVTLVGLVIRNFIVLQNQKLLVQDLWPQLNDAIKQLDIKQVRQLCQSRPTLFTSILDAGMERAENGVLDMAAMEKSMEEASTEQMSSYMVPINFVNTIAVVSPMIGLLGTVSGMIKAFFSISLGGMGKPEMLANNIGEALVTTEIGLVIAIPAMAFYFYFKNNFVRSVATAGRTIGKMLDALRTEVENTQTHAS